jgi:hypothetical protein
MAKDYKKISYFATRPDVVRVFDDLDNYLNYCRVNLRPFNPADLYRKDSAEFQAYLNSRRPRRPYMGNKPRWENRR